MIKKFKLFLSPIKGLTNWLNKMSDEGYRLMKVGNTFFTSMNARKENTNMLWSMLQINPIKL